MHIKSVDDIVVRVSGHGEQVQELIGLAAGGSAAYSLATIALPPGKASRLHFHPDAEEAYSVLAGRGTVRIDDETVVVTVGQSVAIPAKAIHQIRNVESSGDLVFLAISVPAWTPTCSVFLD